MKTLNIIGVGDVATRALPLLSDWHINLYTRAILDLDTAITNNSLFEQLKSCDALLYTAPPASQGMVDVRLKTLLAFYQLHPNLAPKHWVYISTSGVYGDCQGAWVNEETPTQPISARAIRRVDAENQLLVFAQQSKTSVVILRAPGIYAAERLPLQRLRDGVPILNDAEDAYSNHIHANDLAQICVAALNTPTVESFRVYNASDDTPLKMGAWFSALATAAQLPQPPRCTRAELMEKVSEMQWGFLRESRRLDNQRMKQELKVHLKYTSALDFLSAHFKPTDD